MTKIRLLNSHVEKIAARMGLATTESVTNIKSITYPNGKTDCLLVKGDNLQALSGLLATGSELIDFCYIDPPYNTGQQFIYTDSRLRSSNGVWGRHHDWLVFMLPRLVATQILLKPTGVIAISIDDYEYAHLKVLMDNVFGAENHIATLIVCRSKNGKGSKQSVAVNHEYVVLYGKTPKATVSGLAECETTSYDKSDEHGEYKIDGLFRKKGDASLKEDRPNMHYPLYYSGDGKVFTKNVSGNLQIAYPVDSKGVARRWLWGVEKATTESWRLYASKNGVIYVKNYKSAGKKVKLRSILYSPSYLTDRATTETKKLYGEKVFETPKPITLIRDLIDCCASNSATVMDYFAGTGTTAEAAWELNKIDNGKRHVILVEQEAPIKHGHLAARKGFKFISDLTEFRLKSIHKRDPEYAYAVLVA